MEIVLEVLGFLGRLLAAVGIGALGALVGLAICGALELLVRLISRSVTALRRVRGRRDAPEIPIFWDPEGAGVDGSGDKDSYLLTLLVRFDEQSGRFCPSVQVRGGGGGVLTLAWIRLELVDRDEVVRLVKRKRLARTAIGTELSLPAFEPPDGASPDEVLGWHWDVVIEDKEGERARWREHPHPAERLNAEAELA